MTCLNLWTKYNLVNAHSSRTSTNLTNTISNLNILLRWFERVHQLTYHDSPLVVVSHVVMVSTILILQFLILFKFVAIGYERDGRNLIMLVFWIG